MKAFIHHKSGLTVKILESRKNGTLVLKAYVVDPITMRNLSTSPKTCTVQIPEDKEIKKLGLVNKTCADWLKKNRPKADRLTVNNTAPSLVLETFNKLDFDSNYFKQRWNAASTRKQAFVFFRRNTIHLCRPEKALHERAFRRYGFHTKKQLIPLRA